MDYTSFYLYIKYKVLIRPFVDCTPIVVEPAPEVNLEFDQSGPRLMISHIVNENFKSYAGIQTLGPFHKVYYEHNSSCTEIGFPISSNITDITAF